MDREEGSPRSAGGFTDGCMKLKTASWCLSHVGGAGKKLSWVHCTQNGRWELPGRKTKASIPKTAQRVPRPFGADRGHSRKERYDARF